jgi:hypothetical protein
LAEIGHAELARLEDAAALGMGGDHDHRHVGERIGRIADHPDHVGAVEDRHHPVEDQDVGIGAVHRLEPGGAILGLDDAAGAEALQHGAQDRPHIRAVLDDEEGECRQVEGHATLLLAASIVRKGEGSVDTRRRRPGATERVHVKFRRGMTACCDAAWSSTLEPM